MEQRSEWEWEWGNKLKGRLHQPGGHGQDVGLSSERDGGPDNSEQGSNQICLGFERNPSGRMEKARQRSEERLS